MLNPSSFWDTTLFSQGSVSSGSASLIFCSSSLCAFTLSASEASELHENQALYHSR